MDLEFDYKLEDGLSHRSDVQSPMLINQCEKLLSFVLNKTAFLNHQQLTPPYIRDLLAKQNKTFRVPNTIDECVNELQRLKNNNNETDYQGERLHPTFALQERSSSLIVFVILIGLVSVISVIGNLCLAKVLYSKRFRLLQTDRIVLCLALSELCLVLIDSPTEMYRFLSYSFTHTWLCRFHTFFESLLSSCIIFYHLLGAFDRFVYIHGHASSHSVWSSLCRRTSTKSGSIVQLILPVICSLPLSICNIMHAHIYEASVTVKTCIVQYNHGTLIFFLIIFYIIPIFIAFFLHAKLVYFIMLKHHRHYSAMSKTTTLSMKQTYLDNQSTSSKKRNEVKQILSDDDQERIQTRMGIGDNGQRRSIIGKGTDTSHHAGTFATPIGKRQSIPGQTMRNNQFNTFIGSRSSGGQTVLSTPSSYYKSTSQAYANANRTVLLLILLLSCYVLCWAPYNIYTWRHAYLSTTESSITNFVNKTENIDFNRTIPSFLVAQFHSDLQRIILLNYSLYLLSMISMCFSFIFYFTLNKQARREFCRFIKCLCPCAIIIRSRKRAETPQNLVQTRLRQYPYEPRNQGNLISKNPLIPALMNRVERNRFAQTKYNTGVPIQAQLRIDNGHHQHEFNQGMSRLARGASKGVLLNYGCQVQCCR